MPLNTRQLEIIRDVIRYGSATDAAEKLGISQAAVSMAIRTSEKLAGYPLFTRRQGRLQPTPEAKMLFPLLERIFDDVERTQRLVEDLKDSKIGYVRVAANPILADNLLPLVSRQFLSKWPQIQLSILAMPNHEVLDYVTTERVDFGFVFAAGNYFEARVVELCELDLVCVAPSDHPIAQLDCVGPRDLTKFPFISFSTNLTLGALVEEFFRLEGIKRQFSVGVTQSSTACALVRAGVGLAILDPIALMGINSEGLVKIKLNPTRQVKVELILPAQGRVSRTARLFIKSVRENIRTLFGPEKS